jgi:hypothetical protein
MDHGIELRAQPPCHSASEFQSGSVIMLTLRHMTQDPTHFNGHRNATGSLEWRSWRKQEGISTQKRIAGGGVTATVGHGATL